jgi:hypothetical protein
LIAGAASCVDLSLNFLNWGVKKTGLPVEKADKKITALGQSSAFKSLQNLTTAVVTFDPFDLVDNLLDSTLASDEPLSSSPSAQRPVPEQPEHQPRASLSAVVSSPSVVVSRVALTATKGRDLSRRVLSRTSEQANAVQKYVLTHPPVAQLLPLYASLPSLSFLRTRLPARSSVASFLLNARSQVLALPLLHQLFGILPSFATSAAKSVDAKLVELLKKQQQGGEERKVSPEMIATTTTTTTTITETVLVSEEEQQQEEARSSEEELDEERVFQEQDSGFIFEPSQDLDVSE